MNLTDFRVLTFDCYGTLIDWERGILDRLGSVFEREGAPAAGDALLEAYARHESAQQAETPAMRYPELLSKVYLSLAAEWRVAAETPEAHAFGASVGRWPVFPDSKEALSYLEGHYRLVILSNVDRDSFTASNETLGVRFDAVYTAEDIGSYKPALRNFEEMIEGTRRDLGFGRDDILHVAQSLFHDHAPAKSLGLATCWIDRRHDRGGFGATAPPSGEVTPDFRFESLAALVEAHRVEGGG